MSIFKRPFFKKLRWLQVLPGVSREDRVRHDGDCDAAKAAALARNTASRVERLIATLNGEDDWMLCLDRKPVDGDCTCKETERPRHGHSGGALSGNGDT